MKSTHKTPMGTIASISERVKQKQIQEFNRQKKLVETVLKYWRYVNYIILGICLVLMVVNFEWSSGPNMTVMVNISNNVFLYMLFPCILFASYLFFIAIYRPMKKAEWESINRPYGYDKATVSGSSIRLYVHESEDVVVIPMEDVLELTYNKDTNTMFIKHNSLSDDREAYGGCETFEEFEDVFVPPIHEAFANDQMYKEV